MLRFFPLFFAVLILAGPAKAQFIDGFEISVNLNRANVIVDESGMNHTPQNGFGLGVAAEKQILPFLSLVAGLEYSRFGYGYDISIVETDVTGQPTGVTYEAGYESSMDIISLPVLFRGYAPLPALSNLYLAAGPRLDYKAGYTSGEDVLTVQDEDFLIRDAFPEESRSLVLGGSAGLGLNYSIAGIPLQTEVRYNFDLQDLIEDDSFAGVRKHSLNLRVAFRF